MLSVVIVTVPVTLVKVVITVVVIVVVVILLNIVQLYENVSCCLLRIKVFFFNYEFLLQ